MTTPFFSVVVPVHNAAATIRATIASVLVQSDADFEIILIDDGSTDESLPILIDLATSDARIRVVSQNNAGVAATRNLGVELSRGAMIAFLDADDLWHPEKLTRHRAFHAREPQVAASFARIAFVDPNAHDERAARTLSKIARAPLSVAGLLAENPVCTMSNLVVRRGCLEAVGGFRRAMSFAEDQEWLIRAAVQGFAIEGIDAVLVSYRLSPEGLSVNLEQMYAGWRAIAYTYGDSVDLAAAEAVFCRYLARRALRSGTSAWVPLHYAMRGLRRDATAFLRDARRGWCTLAAALFALALPRAARLRVFA